MIPPDPERIPLSVAICYCSILSISFVLSLYCLIPPSIRKLDRDHYRHIQWRTAATVTVCVVATSIQSSYWQLAPEHHSSLTLKLQAVGRVLAHTALLYMGTITQMVLDVILHTQQQKQQSSSFSSFIASFIKIWYESFIAPLAHSFFFTTSPNERWIRLRNHVIAPMTEEILFRHCMVPVLRAAGMSTTHTVMLAPLLFGTAHVHHVLSRWHQHPSRSGIIQTALFQFLYTTVFGSYAVYAYLVTGSMEAVIVSHAFCNSMGLPDVSGLARPNRYRFVLCGAHLTGFFCFVWGFQWLLPDNRIHVQS